jgi:hypothetical protein
MAERLDRTVGWSNISFQEVEDIYDKDSLREFSVVEKEFTYAEVSEEIEEFAEVSEDFIYVVGTDAYRLYVTVLTAMVVVNKNFPRLVATIEIPDILIGKSITLSGEFKAETLRIGRGKNTVPSYDFNLPYLTLRVYDALTNTLLESDDDGVTAAGVWESKSISFTPTSNSIKIYAGHTADYFFMATAVNYYTNSTPPNDVYHKTLEIKNITLTFPGYLPLDTVEANEATEVVFRGSIEKITDEDADISMSLSKDSLAEFNAFGYNIGEDFLRKEIVSSYQEYTPCFYSSTFAVGDKIKVKEFYGVKKL